MYLVVNGQYNTWVCKMKTGKTFKDDQGISGQGLETTRMYLM